MPETPDFDQIAVFIAERFASFDGLSPIDRVNTITAIAMQLRLIWNARGAATS